MLPNPTLYLFRRGAVALAALIAVTVAAGCNEGKKQIESSENLKQLSAAAIKYREDHYSWPDTLEQLKPMLGKNGPLGVIGNGKTWEGLITNPLTGDNPGYEYVKPANDTGGGILLYQLRGGKRDTSLPVAYADGSVRSANGS